MYIVLNHIRYVLVHFFWLLLLSMKLFVFHFVPYFDFSEGILCVSFCANFLSIWLPVLVRPFTFTENSDYDIIFTSVIFQWLVQSQSEWNCCRWFGVNLLVSWCQAFCLCLYLWKICISHHNDFMLPTLHFWRIWSSLIRRS